MKLKKFDSVTAPSMRGAGASPFISLRIKGASTINHLFADAMNIKPGERIAFFQDEEDPEDWYIAKDGKEGFEVRKNYDKSTSAVIFNASGAVRKIFESKKWEEETAKCSVKGEPVKHDKKEYFLILFSSAEVNVIKRKTRKRSDD